MKEHKTDYIHYTCEKYTADVRYSLLVFFHFMPYFCPFLRSILTWKAVRQRFPSPSFYSFGGFPNQLQVEDEHVYCAGDESTLLGMETNEFRTGDKHFSAGNEHIENTRSNFRHTHSQVATSDLQTDLMSRWLLLMGTHLYTVSNTLRILVLRLLRFPTQWFFGHGTYSQAKLGLLNACVTARVSRSMVVLLT